MNVGYGWFVHPFVFDTEIENCQSITIKTTVGKITEGSPYVKWNLYARIPVGSWVLVGSYYISDNVQTYKFTLDKPLSINAVATQLQEYGLFTFDFAYEVSEVLTNPERESTRENVFSGHRYEVVNKSMQYGEAANYASGCGGYWATITSEEEEIFIEHLISDQPMYQYWLGGVRQSEELSDFIWITGEDFSYTNWETFEPSYFWGCENCLQICRIPNPKTSGKDGRIAWKMLQLTI